jgi:hypothetical protein
MARPAILRRPISNLKSSDSRAVVAREEGAGEALLRGRVNAALASAGRQLTDASLESVVEDLADLATDADAIRERMIAAGRRLLRLQATAGEGGYKALLAAGLVPIPEGMASKLRAVARMVEAGVVPPERIPRTLHSAYAAARLAPEIASRLVEDGVLHPTTTARQIVEAAALSPEPRTLIAPLAPAERRALERRARRLREKLAQIEEKLAMR